MDTEKRRAPETYAGKTKEIESEIARFEDLEREFAALESKYKKVTADWQEDIEDVRFQMQALREGVSALDQAEGSASEEIDGLYAAMETARQDMDNLVATYRAQARLLHLEHEYQSEPGAELLDKEHMEQAFGPQLAEVARQYEENKGSMEGINLVSLEALRQGLGMDVKEFAVALEEFLETAHASQARDLYNEEKNKEAGMTLGQRLGRMGRNITQRMSVSMATTFGITKGLTLGAAALGVTSGVAGGFVVAGTVVVPVAALVGGRYLVQRWRNNRKVAQYESSITGAVTAQEGNRSEEQTALAEGYQRNLVDAIRFKKADQLEAKHQKGERASSWEDIRRRYVSGNIIDKNQLRAELTARKEQVEKEAFELVKKDNVDQAEIEAVKKKQQELDDALQVFYFTESTLELEREVAASTAKGAEQKAAPKAEELVKKGHIKQYAGYAGYGLVTRGIYKLAENTDWMPWLRRASGAAAGAYAGYKAAEMGMERWGRPENKIKKHAIRAGAALAGGLVGGALGHEADKILHDYFAKPQAAGAPEGVQAAPARIPEGINPVEPPAAGNGGIPPDIHPSTEGAGAAGTREPIAGQALASGGFKEQNLGEIISDAKFKGLPMEEKYAVLENAAKQNQLARWEDEIRTPEGSSKHDSIWASTRSLLKAHAVELGVNKTGADLDKWAETQTANLVKQLGLDEGGNVKDLVHNGDKVVLYKGADKKLYLRFDQTSGDKAGFLAEHKAASPTPVAAEEKPGPSVTGEAGAAGVHVEPAGVEDISGKATAVGAGAEALAGKGAGVGHVGGHEGLKAGEAGASAQEMASRQFVNTLVERHIAPNADYARAFARLDLKPGEEETLLADQQALRHRFDSFKKEIGEFTEEIRNGKLKSMAIRQPMPVETSDQTRLLYLFQGEKDSRIHRYSLLEMDENGKYREMKANIGGLFDRGRTSFTDNEATRLLGYGKGSHPAMQAGESVTVEIKEPATPEPEPAPAPPKAAALEQQPVPAPEAATEKFANLVANQAGANKVEAQAFAHLISQEDRAMLAKDPDKLKAWFGNFGNELTEATNKAKGDGLKNFVFTQETVVKSSKGDLYFLLTPKGSPYGHFSVMHLNEAGQIEPVVKHGFFGRTKSVFDAQEIQKMLGYGYKGSGAEAVPAHEPTTPPEAHKGEVVPKVEAAVAPHTEAPDLSKTLTTEDWVQASKAKEWITPDGKDKFAYFEAGSKDKQIAIDKALVEARGKNPEAAVTIVKQTSENANGYFKGRIIVRISAEEAVPAEHAAPPEVKAPPIPEPVSAPKVETPPLPEAKPALPVQEEHLGPKIEAAVVPPVESGHSDGTVLKGSGRMFTVSHEAKPSIVLHADDRVRVFIPSSPVIHHITGEKLGNSPDVLLGEATVKKVSPDNYRIIFDKEPAGGMDKGAEIRLVPEVKAPPIPEPVSAPKTEPPPLPENKPTPPVVPEAAPVAPAVLEAAPGLKAMEVGKPMQIDAPHVKGVVQIANYDGKNIKLSASYEVTGVSQGALAKETLAADWQKKMPGALGNEGLMAKARQLYAEEEAISQLKAQGYDTSQLEALHHRNLELNNKSWKGIFKDEEILPAVSNTEHGAHEAALSRLRDEIGDSTDYKNVESFLNERSSKFQPGERRDSSTLLPEDRGEYIRFRAREAAETFLREPNEENRQMLLDRVDKDRVAGKFGSDAWKEVDRAFGGKYKGVLESIKKLAKA